jgi:hypothetical protein
LTILGFAAITAARPGVALPLRGLGPHQVLHVTLIEDDGTSWSRAVPADSTWSEPLLPLASFAIGRGVKLPQGFPGEWNYWVGPADARGRGADRPRLERLERRSHPRWPVWRGSGVGMLEFGGDAADR